MIHYYMLQIAKQSKQWNTSRAARTVALTGKLMTIVTGADYASLLDRLKEQLRGKMGMINPQESFPITTPIRKTAQLRISHIPSIR